MSAPIVQTNEWKPSFYDMVIDVRSPGEFANDHIPSAVNMPVLSDAEHSEVGKLYKQKSSFLARKRGAAMAAKNIANHLETRLDQKGRNFSPLINCWRGGQRSMAFAQVCSEIGWRIYILKGGYKTYRRAVLEGLKELPLRLNFIVIAGRTGSGKTKILAELIEEGAQVLDLEKLAVHRGSLLGRIENHAQPTQRLFESTLHAELMKLNPMQPVYVESESSRIGNIQLPSSIWKRIVIAPMISIKTPVAARARYLLSEYKNLKNDLSDLNLLLTGMVYRHGHTRVDIWQDLIKSKKWKTLASDLLCTHYDPAYDKSIHRRNRQLLEEINQQDCEDKTVKRTARKILDIQRDNKLGSL